MVNITITKDMTQDAVIALAHKATAIPSMILLYIVFGVSLFLAGLGFKDSDTSWGRFGWIWFTAMIITGAFLVFFAFSPNVIQWVVTKWDLLWV